MIALVLGSAACLWADLEAAKLLVGPDPVIVACNDAGWQYPGHLHHWASFHAHEFLKWKPKRAALGRNMDFVTWSNPSRAQYVDRVYPTTNFGSSGWLAMMVALQEADKPLLCGIPMDEQKHIEGATSHQADARFWLPARNFQPQWETWKRKHPEQARRVRSMSGWTHGLLGGPDDAWLR